MCQFRPLIVLGVLAAALNFSSPRDISAQFDELIGHVPETANALVLVNAQKLFASPVAQQQNWQADRAKRFEGGLTGLPPKADLLVLAYDIDVEQMHANWEIAVAKMQADVSVASLAQQYKAIEDQIDSVPAVRLPDDSFVVEFGDSELGVMRPGNRQSVAAWITRTNHSLAPYLQEGVRFADEGAEIIMAIGLQNAYSPQEVEAGIERFASVKNSDVDRTKLSALIASVKGVMLGVTFGDKPYGKIKVDFGQDASILKNIAKPFMVDVLSEHGMMLDEVNNWKPEIKGTQVFLGGDLTQSGLMRLASLIELPSPALHAAATASPSDSAAPAGGQDDTSSVLATTKSYYDHIQRLLENLRAKKSDMRTLGQLAQWFENYGRHVDQLPTLHVDKEMLQYGNYISSQLHGASMALKGTTMQRDLGEMNASQSARPYGGALGNISQNNWQQGSYGWGGGSFGGNYGRVMETNAAYGMAARLGWGGAIQSELRQQQSAITAVHAQAQVAAGASVQQIVQNIESATTKVRQDMTDKYQVQF